MLQLKPRGFCISPWSGSARAARQQRGANNILFSLEPYVRQSQSRGPREAKKGHYSEPGMDEPSLTHALRKHCSLCSVILFHIPLVLITFSFSIYSTGWLESRLMPSPEISQHAELQQSFVFQDATEPHFAISNLQIDTPKN